MTEDDLSWLSSALATGHPADEACRKEILSGARVRLYGVSNETPSGNNKAWFIELYGRRAEHLARINARHVGGDVAERLAACDYDRVRLVGVHGEDNFVVFVAEDEPVVIASLGVDGSLANPEFTDW